MPYVSPRAGIPPPSRPDLPSEPPTQQSPSSSPSTSNIPLSPSDRDPGPSSSLSTSQSASPPLPMPSTPADRQAQAGPRSFSSGSHISPNTDPATALLTSSAARRAFPTPRSSGIRSISTGSSHMQLGEGSVSGSLDPRFNTSPEGSYKGKGKAPMTSISPTTPLPPGSAGSDPRPDTSHPSSTARRRATSEDPTMFGSSSKSPSRSTHTPPLGIAFPSASSYPEPAPEQAQLFDSIRRKVSIQDQEAMRKMRQTMESSPIATAGSPLLTKSSSEAGPSRGPKHVAGQSEAGQIASEASQTTQARQQPSRRPHADFVMAVVGHKGVGKSTVIRRATKAWGSSEPLLSKTDRGYTVTSTFSHVQPGNKLKYAWTVEMLEVDLYALDLSPEGRAWPRDVVYPSGVVMCYDAQAKQSLRGFEQAVRKLSKKGIPMVILACKTDPGATLEVEAAYGNSIGEPYNVGLIEVTAMTPDGKSKMRNGLRWLLYKLEQRMRRDQRLASTPDSDTTPPASQPVMDDAAKPESDGSSSGHGIMWRRDLSMTHSRGAGRPSTPDTRSSSSSLQWITKAPINSDPSAFPSPPPIPLAKSPRHGGGNESTNSTMESNMNTRSTSNLLAMTMAREPPPYLSLEDLLNQVFSAIVSTEDEALVRAFFMTYRRFCKPQEVMQEFLDRFHEVEGYAISNDIKMWALLKMTGALIDWTSTYPGDLADEPTARIFREILDIIFQLTYMAHLAVELVDIEAQIGSVPDVDDSWSYKGPQKPAPARASTAPLPSPTGEGQAHAVDGSSMSHIASTTGALPDSDSPTASMISRTQTMQTPAGGANTPGSYFPLQPIRSESTKSSITSTSIPSTISPEGPGSLQYAANYVLNIEPKEFAAELTRMHWQLFRSIRPRDVFRHDLGKEVDTPVGRSIAFFNHLSRWTSTVILASPKAKHRAKTYERFIHIVHELRRLGNYDSLYAIIAGIKETSIHRLSQTHALVQLSPAAEKDWQSHLKLMDPKGGYAFYRRALKADISHERGSIPLMTNLLGLIARLQAVRKEDRRTGDGLIQWDKFAKFAEILGVITDCQEGDPMVTGPPVLAFQQLIHDTPIIQDEDGLFARSRLLEPNAEKSMGGAGGMMRKFVNMGLT